MSDAATANRLAREARTRDHAARVARLTPACSAATPPTADIPRVSTPAGKHVQSTIDDRDSAAGVLALARAYGLPGLKAPAETPAVSPSSTAPANKEHVTTASKKDDADSAAGVLANARAAGIPGLR